MMASIYRTLLREIEHDNFQVLHQRISLTPLRKFWLAWKVQALGPLVGAPPDPWRCHRGAAGWAWPLRWLPARPDTMSRCSRPRARGWPRPAGPGARRAPVRVDNGQHILIGAYTETLRLMRLAGVAPETTVAAPPLALPFVDGGACKLPVWAANWPAPLDAMAAIATARGWGRAPRFCCALGWRARFRCESRAWSVANCAPPWPHGRARADRTAVRVGPEHAGAEASASVFACAQDALFGVRGGSHLLVPRVDLGALFPEAAARWLAGQAWRHWCAWAGACNNCAT